MPGALLTRVRPVLALGACAALLGLFGAPALAQRHDAQVSLDVPKGKTKSVRLRRLPLGTSLAVAVEASGTLRVALVSARELASGAPRAMFSGALEHKMAFKVVVPESGDYYLVLDNRAGTDDVNVTAAVRAEPRRGPPARPMPKEKADERAESARSCLT